MKKYENNLLTLEGKLFFWALLTVWMLFVLYSIFFESQHQQIIWLFYPLFLCFISFKKIWVDKDTRKIVVGYKKLIFSRSSFDIDTITSIRIVRTRKGKYRNLEIRSGQHRFFNVDPREYEAFINEITSLNNSIEILTYSTWNTQSETPTINH